MRPAKDLRGDLPSALAALVPPELQDSLPDDLVGMLRPMTPPSVVVPWLRGLAAGPWVGVGLAEVGHYRQDAWAAALTRVYGEAMRAPFARARAVAGGLDGRFVTHWSSAGPDPDLAAALALLAPQTAARCVSALIDVWRIRLDPLLADLIDVVDAAWIPAFPPDAVQRALVARATPAELGSRSWKGFLGQGGSEDAIRRRVLMAVRQSAMSADPRRGPALWPYAALWQVVGAAGGDGWASLGQALRDQRLGWPSAPDGDELAQTLPLGPADRAAVRAAMASLGRVAADVHVLAESRLLREVYEAPDDDGPRQVVADFWVGVGDPRGEFVRRQLANPEEVAMPMDVPMTPDGPWVLLASDPGGTRFQRGFPFHAQLVSPGQARWDRGWATVRRLSLGANSARTAGRAEFVLGLLEAVTGPLANADEICEVAGGPAYVAQVARARTAPFKVVWSTHAEMLALGPETTDAVRLRAGAVPRPLPAVRVGRLIVQGENVDVASWLARSAPERVTLELVFAAWDTGWVLELSKGASGRLSVVEANWRGPPRHMGVRGLIGVLVGLPVAAIERLTVRAPGDLVGLHELRTVLPRLRGTLEVLEPPVG